jgi:hypothetical protein
LSNAPPVGRHFDSNGQLQGSVRQILSRARHFRALPNQCVSWSDGPPTKGKIRYRPDGSPLTIADLPAPGAKRWVIRRKAEVVAAVRGGLLSLEEACSRHTLTVEEFLSWQYSIVGTVSPACTTHPTVWQ